MDYDSDLASLKRSFDGGGEGPFFFRALERVAARRHLAWLDIGIGRNGSALRPFVQACRSRGQTLEITGIDPDAEPGEREEDGVGWRLVRGEFQAWSHDGTYDVINADQAFYYLGDPQEALGRIHNLLRPGGLFIATCWSREDALRLLRMRLWPDACDDLTGEDLVAMVRSRSGFEAVETEAFTTQVRFSDWRLDSRLLEPALRVIARRPLDAEAPPQTAALRAILGELPDAGQRVNIALCAIRGD